MRTEAEKLKQDMRDAKEEKERMEIKLIDVQERLKFLEAEKGKFEGNFFSLEKWYINLRFNVCNKKNINFETGHKEHLIEQEQALMVAKQRFRDV